MKAEVEALGRSSSAGQSVRKLSVCEIAEVDALSTEIRARLLALCKGDQRVFFSLQRRLMTRLKVGDSIKDVSRRQLQLVKYAEQGGCCAICLRFLSRDGALLHRLDPQVGFTSENTQLIHSLCKPVSEA